MKKLITLILALGMILALCACGAGSTTEAPAPEAAEGPSEAINNEPVEVPDPEPPAAVTEDAEIAEPVREAEENTAASGEASGNRSASRGPSGGMGMGKSSDAELTAMIEAIAPKFTVEEYTDEETGLTVEYNVFLPEGYDETTQYPMIVFIPDSSVVSRGAEAVLTQGWGALIWATEAEQEKHPAIVIAPVFTEVILDDHNGFVTTDYVDMVPRMVQALAEKYNADTDRLYATGQSMGCMTMLIAAANNPDLFAAELFVDGQWDITTLKGLESQTFFYIAAGGDDKAVGGQDEVMALLDEDEVPYSYSEGWDAQSSAEELTALVEAELAEGNVINLVRWEPGTVLNGGSGMEHMASFDYAYKLETVRDWLFEQTK